MAVPSSLIVIAKARVPIVKFVTRYGGFSVDLSVNQQGGVDAAVRVRAMLEEHAFRDDNWIEPGSSSTKNGKGKGKEPDLIEGETESEDHGVARSLVLLVKAFLNQRGMNEVFTGGLGSYSIICLVVSFLQVCNSARSIFSELSSDSRTILAASSNPIWTDTSWKEYWFVIPRIQRILRKTF